MTTLTTADSANSAAPPLPAMVRASGSAVGGRWVIKFLTLSAKTRPAIAAITRHLAGSPLAGQSS